MSLLALGGFLYQSIAWTIDEKRDPEPGRRVDIGGLSLNLHCTGAGSPTVVLESGLGGGLDEWSRVQAGISRFARVCSYDRGGYGRSDPGPFPRTSSLIADELHRLLRSAGERPPYVLVGASFGGYNVRVYLGRYPAEVAGMVLVDATQEDQYRLLPPAWNVLGASMLARYRDQARWASLNITFGITRFRLWLQGVPVPHRILQTKYLKARASELESIQVSAEQARAAGKLGSKPLIVLTAGKHADAALRGGLSADDLAAYGRIWIQDLQPRLAALSERGNRIVVPDSGHDIAGERPDAVVEAVRDLLKGQ